MKEIIVLFKTHLDIGYTDFAEAVTKNYMETYVPSALRVARETRGKPYRFIWTTGSWLIERFLEESPLRGEMEEAIAQGDIRWHGLPFTTHTELMDASLFQYGLSISKDLDRRFGMTTIAGKMTDVPGHTRAMIPHLAQAGIKFLHLGVNPASSVPDVPSLFRWRAPSGEEVIVMYNKDYGEFSQLGNTDTAIYFAHTGDNRGPQSAEEIRNLYEDICRKHPEAYVHAGTLEDAAKVVMEIPDLPVVTSEIGDSWIHGIGTDPGKVSQYRTLLRLSRTMEAAAAQNLYKNLIMVPEHTWGLCHELFLGYCYADGTVLGEHDYYARKDFEQMRPTEKFQIMERSWQEQRGYLNQALNALPEECKLAASSAMSTYKRRPTDKTGYRPIPPVVTEENGDQVTRYDIQIGSYDISVGNDGSLTRLVRKGCALADKAHPIGKFCYEVFSPEDFSRFTDQYLTNRYPWAVEEFGKIGMENAVTEHLYAEPKVSAVLTRDNSLLLELTMDGAATELFGAPENLELLITFQEDRICFDLAWFQKKANRIAESLWFGFCPTQRLTSVHKMGQWIPPQDVVKKGGRRLHGVDEGVRFENVTVTTVDTPLAAVGKPSLLNFTDDPIPVDDGVYFNLFNNIWNTNFPMWYDEDARFRFEMRF